VATWERQAETADPGAPLQRKRRGLIMTVLDSLLCVILGHQVKHALQPDGTVKAVCQCCGWDVGESIK